MAADELEIHQIGDKQYVTVKKAARYLGISKNNLTNLILLGKVEATQIEKLQLIELETLKEYARKRKQSVWDRLEEWRGQNK